MKKIIKVCLIAGLVCVFVGGGITAAAAVMGGTMAVKNYDKSYAWSNFWANMAHSAWDWRDWEESWRDWDEWGDWEEADEHYSFTAKEVTFSDIKELELTGAVGTVKIVNGGDAGQIGFKFEDDKFYDCFRDGDKIEIKKNKMAKVVKKSDSKQGNITVTVPEGFKFRKAELEIDAGDMLIDELNADSAELEAKAGEIRVKSGSIGKFSAECKAGGIYCKAGISGNVEVDCEAGEVELVLSGSQQDYNYEIDGKMGGITVGSDTYNDMKVKKEINNSASKSMELDCSAGEITVKFES